MTAAGDPSIKAHRPKLILPYIAGPEGTPLLDGDEKVTRLSAPPQPRHPENEGAS